LILNKVDIDLFLELNENNAKQILKDFALGIQLKFWKNIPNGKKR